MALFGPGAMSDLSPQCATKRTSINVIDLSVHPLALSAHDALAGARPVGEPGMARAVGQAFERRVAAKTEIGKRHLSSFNSSSEQQCPLWIGSSSAAGCRSPYNALSI